MTQPMHTAIAARMLDRERLARLADGLAIALAASLPWSTTATGILALLLLLALLPTLNGASVRRELSTAAGGLPLLLWALGVVGMIWADVPLAERLDGLDSFHKLLFIPLLMIHFRRSAHGAWTMNAFLLSCSALLVVSWTVWLFPDLAWHHGKEPGIPVKDRIAQSAMFTICTFILVDIARAAWRRARRGAALACLLLALTFLANIFFIATSRTALVVIPLLLLLFGFKRFDWQGTVGLAAALAVLAAAAWLISDHLRNRVLNFVHEVQIYRSENVSTSAGERLEFWQKSLRFVAAAPLIGHGTGAIREQFRQAVVGEAGASALAAANPHNQTLAVAIQLGLVGVAALYAMWIAHLFLFRGEGLTAWIGLIVVVQNLAGSLFNSHLFDFTHGWVYVLGVGVAGGVVCAARESGAGSGGNKVGAP